MTAIVESYRDGLGREPIQAELQSILAFHRGDARLGVDAGFKRDPSPTDP